MKQHWFHILMALAREDLHGSGIVRAVLTGSDGRLRIWPVMLYRCLEDLMATGLIVELTQGEERPVGESHKKRFFRITEEGRRALAIETDHLGGIVEEARRRLAANSGEGA